MTTEFTRSTDVKVKTFNHERHERHEMVKSTNTIIGDCFARNARNDNMEVCFETHAHSLRDFAGYARWSCAMKSKIFNYEYMAQKQSQYRQHDPIRTISSGAHSSRINEKEDQKQ